MKPDLNPVPRAVQSSGLSDTGRIRPVNEDRLLVDDEHGLYAVADGMGGHRAGEVASELAIESLRRYLAGNPSPETAVPSETLSASARRLLASIRWSNRRVHEAAASSPDLHGMGSTIAAVYVAGDSLVAANVGDSPIFLIREGAIERLSVSHTLRDEVGAEGVPASLGHVLTRALGPEPSVEPAICEVSALHEDAVVICSDGLSNKLSPEEIRDIVLSHPPEWACREMISRANARGGEDNISAVVLRFGSPPQGRAARLRRFLSRRMSRITALLRR
ncbi:MAG: protein phosphatase 2C domain-containing protein [Desulfobacterales bacterium]